MSFNIMRCDVSQVKCKKYLKNFIIVLHFILKIVAKFMCLGFSTMNIIRIAYLESIKYLI